jgi:hypothetical protein
MVLESLTELPDRRLSKNNKTSAPVLHSVALEVCGLYPERQPSIWKRPGQKRWMQWSQALTDSQILGVMSDEGRGLFRGCYWGSETRHAVLDIDKGSEYHNPKCLAELVAEFSQVGLTLVPYQSSESGGWHLYLFFDSYVLSKEVETTIRNYLQLRKYEIRGGTLELFPSGNALRLPLQRGFAWLSDNGIIEVTREELTQGQALALFFNDLETKQTNWQQARSRIESQLRQIEESAGDGDQEHRETASVAGLAELFTNGLDHEKYQRGREYWLNGLTGPNQRHDAVCCIGHYLWYGDSSQGLKALPYPSNAGARAELITAWIKEKHNGHSEAVNLGRLGEVESQIERACYWTAQGALVRQRESYPVTERLVTRLCQTKLTPDDFKKANRRKEGAARAKIKRALAQCVDEGRQVTRNVLAEISGCSPNTVSKHADLWSLLATGSHAYITGGLGGSSGGALVLARSEGLVSESSGSLVKKETLREPVCPSGSGDLAEAGSVGSPLVPPFLGPTASVPVAAPSFGLASVLPLSPVLILGPWLARPAALSGVPLSPSVSRLVGVLPDSDRPSPPSKKSPFLGLFGDSLCEPPSYRFFETSSANSLPTLNFATVLAGMCKGSFVLGLRPERGLRLRASKVPKPTSVTFWPFATCLLMVAMTLFMTASVIFCVQPTSLETAKTKSALFMALHSTEKGPAREHYTPVDASSRSQVQPPGPNP